MGYGNLFHPSNIKMDWCEQAVDCRNNILDTKPMEKAKVTVYNFQLQAIGTDETNSEGFTEITPKVFLPLWWPE